MEKNRSNKIPQPKHDTLQVAWMNSREFRWRRHRCIGALVNKFSKKAIYYNAMMNEEEEDDED